MGGPSENEHGVRIIFPDKKRFPNMPVTGPDRRFMALVAYLGGDFNVCCNKWYGSNYINPGRGLPRSILMVTLNDVDTGEPLAVMSANLISAMRTGAVPAVGAKYLESKDAKVAAIIGGGVIGKATLLCLQHGMKNLSMVKIYDINKEKGQQFAKEMARELGIPAIATDSLEEAIRGSDFVNLATSGAVKPIIEDEWLKENVVISTQALAGISDELFENSNIVMDEWKMHLAWKHEEDQIPESEAYKKTGLPSMDLFRLIEAGKVKEKNIRSLGPIAMGKTPGRKSENERFILLVGGLPVEDAAWSLKVYQNAVKMGIGQKLLLWNEPHWF
jgi:ornithine cyclodeaminase